MLEEEPQRTFEEFAKQITDHTGETEAAGIIFSFLEEYVCVEGFCPSATDPLEYLYGIAEEELDEDIIVATFEKMGLPLPSDRQVAKIGVIRTSVDIARLIGEVRKA